MGLARKLKDAAAAKLKELEAPPSEEELAKLTPAQRERYDAFTAQAEQARAGEPVIDGRLLTQPLHGPAGEVIYKVVKAPKLSDRIEDPAEWEAAMLADRATRDAAREPYLAQARAPIRISRVAAQGGTQAEEVAQHLASTGLAARPELVYGLYRVPDRLGPSGGTEKKRIVEWDVVHAATEPLPPAEPPADVFFDAAKPWVARRPGEPSILDEDLALAYLVKAGVGPERTLGVARHCVIDPFSDVNDQTYISPEIHGVHVFHPVGAGETVAREMAAAAPLTLEGCPPDGVRLDLINWGEVARAVHPVRHQRPRLPSPFPYLPLTAQELLRSYLEIVGIAPQDSYGAQVTCHRPIDLMGRTSTGEWISVRRTTGGDKVPCADGEQRVRMEGGQHIVLAYRDSERYAEGRQRWAAYQTEVLQADLERQIHPRDPVPQPPSRLERAVDAVGHVVAVFDPDEKPDDLITPRYCWPPA